MRLYLLLLALAIPASVSAQTTGTISGTITTASGGAPLSAGVELFDPSNPGPLVSTTFADSAGHYSFVAVVPGTYYLRASATGFVQQAYAGVTCIAVDCAIASGTPITVTAGSSATANVALVQGGSVAGTIRKSDGTLAFGSSVSLYNAAGSLVVGGANYAADGSYQFTGLAAGIYFARTTPNAYLTGVRDYLDELYGGTPCPVVPQVGPCPVVRGAPITVNAGATTSGIDFALDAGGTITGTVTGAGEPVIVSTAVDAYSGGVRIGTARTDESGRYTIVGLPAGHYTVRTDVDAERTGLHAQAGTSNLVDEWYSNACVACDRSPAGVLVTSGGTTTIDFELVPGGRISGTLVLGPQTPPLSIPGIPAIQVFSAAGTLVRTARTSDIPGTSRAVSWQAAGLPAGTYYIRTTSAVFIPVLPLRATSGLWVDEIYDNIPCVAADCRVDRGSPVVLPAGGQVTGVNITLDYGANITGRYPLRGQGTGDALEQLEVYDARSVRLPGRVGDEFYSGGFRAAGLPTGTYYLKLPRTRAARYPETLYKDIPCNGCSVISGTPVAVTAGESVEIEFAAQPSRALRGFVRSSSGTPLSAITVEVFSQNGATLGSAITMADGTYVFPGLNPGVHYARTVNQRGFVDVLYGNEPCPQCDPLRGMAILVGAAADTGGIGFVLESGSVVAGTLTTVLYGSPFTPGPPTTGTVSGAAVVFRRQDGTVAARAITDSLGRFETALLQGSYDMRLEPLPHHSQTSRTVNVGSAPVTNADHVVFPAGVLTISPGLLAFAAIRAPYRQTLLASSGSAPVLFTIATGRLPPGLLLDSAGVLSGTPTTSGRYTFTVAAADAIGQQGTREYTLDVPPCTFSNPPSPFIAVAAGEDRLFRQTCAAVFTVSTDVPWISAFRSVVLRRTPVGTTAEVSVRVTVATNTSAASRRGHITIGSRVLEVIQSGTASAPPFGFLETPANGAAVNGSVAVSGWALDDLSVTRVAIFRDPVAGEGTAQVFLGDATFVPGARPDVEAVFPSLAMRSRAGWGYLLLTNMLPNGGNGTFNLYAYAVDNHGVSVLLGERAIVVANSTATVPFGAIDTPGQGALVSGASYVNFGWALTPQPKLIPFDGSTISVIIDGVPVGTLNGYNFARSDVSALFPGLKNSPGPIGFRVIDTTALSEGLHTLAWVVTDDAGQSTGIGSRYFTVQNSAWMPSLKAASRAVPTAFTSAEVMYADATTAVPPRVDGVDVDRKVASLADLPVVATRRHTIALKPQQRLELALAPPAAVVAELRKAPNVAPCASSYEGYLAANGELRALPVGSSLDRSGTFYWQPGPAFSGTYQLLFVSTSCDGTRTRIPVSVSIR